MSIGAGGDDFAARYDDLAARARAGDDAAAEELGTALLECKRFTRRLHDAESVVAPGRRFASPEAREAALGEAERFLEAENTRNFERKCRGLTRAQMDGFNDWYEMAALRGDIAAAYSFATLAPLAELAHDPAALMRYRDNASRLMHAAAGQCYGVAFASLANSYAHGTYTPRDPVRSMANNIVSGWLAGSEPSTERVTQQLQLARNAAAPTELQLRQAQALARRLYSRHCQ